jgi:membrane protease subunit (stomatin/prohibitin family)
LNCTFSFRVENPVTFFRNIVGNVKDEYTVADFMGTPAKPQQPRLEFLDNITETLNKCGGPYPNGIMFSTLPSKQGEFRRYMQDCLDDEWLQKRGIVVEKVAIASVTPDDKSRERIEKVDESKLYGQDQAALGAAVALGQTEAMKNAGANANGAVTGFMGLGMMGQVGGNNATAAALNTVQASQGQPQTGFFAGQTVAPAGAPAAAGWTCSCGQTGNTGKFCGNCGQPQPAPVAPAAGWTCSCGQTGNTGKFCGNCGAPAPAAAPTACPKCGYKPADGNMPKFCPECGTKIE